MRVADTWSGSCRRSPRALTWLTSRLAQGLLSVRTLASGFELSVPRPRSTAYEYAHASRVAHTDWDATTKGGRDAVQRATAALAEAEQNGEQHDSPMMAELNERYESALASLEEEVRSSAHSCSFISAHAALRRAPSAGLMLCRVRRLQLNAEHTNLPSITGAEAFEALRAYIGDKLLAGTEGKLYTYSVDDSGEPDFKLVTGFTELKGGHHALLCAGACWLQRVRAGARTYKLSSSRTLLRLRAATPRSPSLRQRTRSKRQWSCWLGQAEHPTKALAFRGGPARIACICLAKQTRHAWRVA